LAIPRAPYASPVAQPVHAAFFTTACWHLQDPDRWPTFQPSSRRVLHAEEGLFTPTGDPVRDYLLFREAFLSLAVGLSLTVWQLEHLCWWHATRTPERAHDLIVYDEGALRRTRPHARTGPGANRASPSLTSRPLASRAQVHETPPP
jgi:hypothetical protein